MSEQPTDPALRARLLRLLASAHRKRAAELDMAAAAAEAGGAMQHLADIITAGEARDIAEHPDLAELNVQLDGFYDDPVRPGDGPTT
ncbi:hypothetical protein [Streptomyces sp. NBC_00198]|uniref:hypothetical protein n=1 Tax=Streptomyces sp. NBC_00198 TaxID=2975677 RepID=UPI002251744F|nr:hypothetical protein [Streptomyces sp. NBC_00198]MCX5285951.1 hypothetical protein [Streptomyces sp. NBC_00198]MCX5286260.1 hypothetical protein [Streptomyces sp. NBC_00198]